MATSGSADFSIDRDGLIEAALRACGVLDPESSAAATTEQLAKGSEALNLIVKSLQTDGMPLWAVSKKTITLVADDPDYTVSALGITRPLRIFQALRTDTNSSTDTPMEVITRDEYYNLGNKTSNGPPILLYYDPQLTDALATVYLYPTPGSAEATNNTVTFWYHRPFEDFDASTDTPDFPQEWYNCVKWMLAADLGFEYGVPDGKLDRIEGKAQRYHEAVTDFGQEEGSVYFVPDTRMNNGR